MASLPAACDDNRMLPALKLRVSILTLSCPQLKLFLKGIALVPYS